MALADREAVKKLLPTVETISPSQIEMHRTCPRKRAIRQLFGGPKAPPSKGTIFGREVDRIIDVAISTGARVIDAADPTPGETARDILAVLPVVGTVSQEPVLIRAPSLSGFSYYWHGYIDVYADRPESIPLVCDVKTRSNEKHIITVEKMPKDPQCVVYAYGKNRGEGVDLEWVTQLTGTKKEPIPVRDRWTHSQVEEYATRLALESDDIIRLNRSKPAKPEDVPYRLEGCDEFGGCPYRGNLCQLPLTAMVEAAFGKEGIAQMSNLMDQLTAQKNGVPAVQTTETGAVKPMDMSAFFGAPKPAPAIDTDSKEYALSKAVPLPAGATAPNGRPLPADVTSSGVVEASPGKWVAVAFHLEKHGPAAVTEILNAAADRAAGLATGVNPPEQAIASTVISASQTQEAPAAPAPLPAPVAPTFNHAETGRTSSAAPNPSNPTHGEPTAPVEAAAPKRRGRPKGSKNTSTAAAPSSSAEVVLYIGCAPVNADYTPIGEIYDLAHQGIERDKQVPDFGLLPFGEGAACFRGYVQAAFAAAGPGDYVVEDPTSREATIVLATLCQSADRIIRGLR